MRMKQSRQTSRISKSVMAISRPVKDKDVDPELKMNIITFKKEKNRNLSNLTHVKMKGKNNAGVRDYGLNSFNIKNGFQMHRFVSSQSKIDENYSSHHRNNIGDFIKRLVFMKRIIFKKAAFNRKMTHLFLNQETKAKIS